MISFDRQSGKCEVFKTAVRNSELQAYKDGGRNKDGGVDASRVEFAVELDAYPATDKIKQRNKTAYRTLFADGKFREYVVRQTADYVQREYNSEIGAQLRVNNVHIVYENRGGFKDIFRISAVVSPAESATDMHKEQLAAAGFTGEVDLCLAVLRPYYEALKGQTQLSMAAFGKDFSAEFDRLKDFKELGGADRRVIVEPYDRKVQKTGDVLYYLREWVDGDTVGASIADKLIGAEELEGIVSVWMTATRVLRKFARYPSLDNVMIRDDGSFVISDLGMVASINERLVIRSFENYYVARGFLEEQTARRAIFSGVIKGLGEAKGRSFLAAALEQGQDEKFALDLKRYLEGIPPLVSQDGGSEDAIDKIELRDKWVRVLSRGGKNSRSKTLASVYAVTLDPDLDVGGKLIWFGPMEVSGFTTKQGSEMVMKLAQAPRSVKDKLGIDAEDALADLLAKYYVVVEDKLLVMSSAGEIFYGKVSKKDITSIGFNNRGRKGDLLKNLAQKKAQMLDGGKDVAGIDFRALPLAGAPLRAPVLTPQLQQMAAGSKISDLDGEWRAIEKQMRTADMPYGRIQEYIAVCMADPGAKKHLEQVCAYMMNILRVEEEQALPTCAELKTILACLG